MMDAYSMLLEFVSKYGNDMDEGDCIQLLCEYIDNQASPETFRDFLVTSVDKSL
jgi:hypothetical protein